MNRLSMLTASAALTFASFGCSAEQAPQPTLEAGMPEQAGQTYRTLLQNDSPINLIYLNSDGDVIPNDNSLYIGYVEMKRHSQGFLEASALALKSATLDGYEPSSITTIDVPGVYSKTDCIDINSEDNLVAAQEAAKPHLIPEAVNVIIADTLFCDEYSSTPGKTSPDYPPLLTAIASYDFNVLLPHEIGHSAGLGHAGEIICKDAIELLDCKNFPTEDYLSVMGYRDGASFSVAELYALGLLHSEDVIENAQPGEYTLSAISGVESDAPHGLIVKSENGDLFLSWEKDPIVSDIEPNTIQIRKAGTDGRVIEFSLLTSNGYVSSQALKNGKLIPGVIYKDNAVTITYLGINERGEGLVQIGENS